jgi:ferredoxin
MSKHISPAAASRHGSVPVSRAERRAEVRRQEVVVDRITCTAHGVCSVMSEGAIELDEFGYPVPSRLTRTPQQAQQIVQACPARALLLSKKP